MGAAVSVGAVAVVEGRTEPVPGHFYALGHAGRDGAFFCLSRRAAAARFGFVLFVVDGGIFVFAESRVSRSRICRGESVAAAAGRVRFADCAAASAAALAVLAASAAYFWHEDALKQWFDYNFLFNRQVAAYYGSYTSGVGTALKLCAAGTAAAIIRFCRCGEKETAWLLLLAGCAGILFVLLRIHDTMSLIFAGGAVCRPGGDAPDGGGKAFRAVEKSGDCGSGGWICRFFVDIGSGGKKASAFKKHMALAEYVIRHTAPDEALLNGVNAYAVNLYNPDADYFWFGFHNTVKIAAYWGYGKFDYNTAIKRHKPKILLLGEDSPLDVIAMSQTKWLKERNLRAAMLGRGNVAGRNDFIRLNYSCWNEDMDYIKKHYDLVEAGSEAMLWVRKDGSGTGNGGGSGQ